MKYKNINSMLHNFGHSFASLMNYVDGEYASDLIRAAVGGLPERRLEIHFPSRRITPQAEYSPKLLKSVGYWADSLPRHMASHGVTKTAVPELVILAYLDGRGMHYRVKATDDRGKEYEVEVKGAA